MKRRTNLYSGASYNECTVERWIRIAMRISPPLMRGHARIMMVAQLFSGSKMATGTQKNGRRYTQDGCRNKGKHQRTVSFGPIWNALNWGFWSVLRCFPIAKVNPEQINLAMRGTTVIVLTLSLLHIVISYLEFIQTFYVHDCSFTKTAAY